MATEKQIAAFRSISEDRNLGPMSEMPALREKFATLSDRNASRWIEAALAREKRSDEEDVPPPFAA